MKIQVPNKFPIVAQAPRIALVGEAPGADEEMNGQPFVGYSGKLLDGVLNKCGILRNACYLGNCYQYRPPNNDIKLIDRMSTEWYDGQRQLKEDLEKFQPDCIIALGETALEVVTGRHSITKWRGSIVSSTLLEKPVKVVPAYHPAYILRQYKWLPILEFDIAKARREAFDPILNLPQRTYKINPTFLEACGYLDAFMKEKRIAFDFETLRGNDAAPLCLGFAPSPTFAVCIPFDDTYTAEEEAEIWMKIEALMMNEDVEKIAHNAFFDMSVLFRWFGITVNNLKMDTMLAWHACYPELPKKLSFLTSILTREPYYKHEHKESEEEENEKGWSSATSKDKLYIYNCKDCCVTYESSRTLDHELDDLKCRDGYATDMALLPIALFMSLRGIKVDAERSRNRFAELQGEVDTLRGMLTAVFGREVNVKSPKQMKELLYDELGLPKQYKDGRLSTDADTLIELARKYPNHNLKLFLKERQLRTKQAFFEIDTWRDGRIHAGFNVAGTETGRWSSSPSILGGRNIMNIPDDCRDIYVADEGKVFIGWDKAQAEARVVAYKSFVETGDSSYKDLVESGQKPHVWFAHKLCDRGIWRCPKDAIRGGLASNETGYLEYYCSKVGVHAFSYRMGHVKFCKVIASNTDGEVTIHSAIAKAIKDTLYEDLPAIPRWQESIERFLAKSRVMFNAFGRARVFFDRYGEDLFAEACAFEPQSTVHDDVARSMKACYEQLPELEILHYNYDSMFGQVDEAKAKEVLEKMRPLVQQPIFIRSFDNTREVSLSIPVEFKVGKSWGEMEEIK